LSISNGWRPFDSFIGRLLSVGEVEHFGKANPERLASLQKAYRENAVSDIEYLDYEPAKNVEAMRIGYYQDSLLVGTAWGVEDDMVILNPHIVFPDGEWEAIFFANWIPGNQRYRSFRDFVAYSVQMLEQ
jgi:hypothetical protein